MPQRAPRIMKMGFSELRTLNSELYFRIKGVCHDVIFLPVKSKAKFIKFLANSDFGSRRGMGIP